MGGAMGSGGGWSKAAAHGPHLDPGRPPDLEAAARAFDQAPSLATMVDPATRAGQWHAHQAQHPGAAYADFLADLEAGRIVPEPGAAQSFRQAAREQLAAGLPASDRKLLENVPVHVLTDAEFMRATRSGKGQAVTIIENGKAIVLVRESAPISALREEGIHAAQLLDPRTAADVKLLDEAHMARWGSLDLKSKLEMYRAKLDLELDAHARLLTGLLEQIDGMPPGVARDALIDQAGAARRNLHNLGERRIELASFGPLDRLKARLGFGTLSARLEQPPRLFSKADLGPAVGAAKKASGRSGRPVAEPLPATPSEAISQGRPDIARRFRSADKRAHAASEVPTSHAFDAAITFLAEHGLSDEGLRTMATRLFAPGRGQRALSGRRFERAMDSLTVLVERIRNNPEMLSPHYPTKRAASLAETASMIVDEAAHQRGAHTVQPTLEAMTAAVSSHRNRPAINPVVRLLDLMELEGMIARASETVRSLRKRFDVVSSVLTVEGGVPALAAQGNDAAAHRLAKIAESFQTPPGRRPPEERLLGLLRLGAVDVLAHGMPGEPLARSLPGMGLEKYVLGARHLADLETAPPRLARWLGQMFADFERAHLVGPGFGDELFAGLALAPREFNQHAQNKGVEKMIRAMVAQGLEPEVRVALHAERLAIPMRDGTFEFIDVVRKIEYTITAKSGVSGVVAFDVSGPPNPGWKVTRNDFPEGVPGGDVLHSAR
jgi:hypothetical protein